ncbi:pyridoxamine 5'-phosphate oxidase family protein [Nocardia abscessus]|uniref:pyridoxamine 5'-phosphate oxidase family protein n=1 Tax=Nocardia abscessus TaxID=120957 RepID=UPI000684520C|nr:pyridoxamine 5'-phosphate oxidase family protein [Nocardia abscessus]MCC3331050.1 pyridoxamine 5'-phosphate oxidase family protein [Nocardia abscessus]
MRPLRESEIADLLTRDVVAHLATIDSAGYPHITPLWFLWLDGRFYLTSYADRPHLERIRSNPRVGLVLDVEDALRADGERPNRQVRVIGTASLALDPACAWTERIRTKYISDDIAPGVAQRDLERARVVITVVPSQITAVASV